MPLQNRVRPDGQIVTSSAKGTLMGNRGILHDENKRLLRQTRNPAWPICRLEFNGRKRELMGPNRYTELFFLDEAVALAAGHRPCGTCRRARQQSYIGAVNASLDDVVAGVTDIDKRLVASRRAERETSPLSELPDGAIVTIDGPEDFHLRRANTLHRWTHHGYTDRVAVGDLADAHVTVVTPSLSIAALRGGYLADIHPSATTPA